MDENFILEHYDEEENIRVQYYYWCNNGRFYRRTVKENGSISRIKRISEAEYIGALEERHNA